MLDYELLKDAPIGVLIAFVVLREFFNYLKSKKSNNNGCNMRLNFDEIEKKVKDLYDWHNVTDQDGVKVWYTRRSLEKSIDKLNETIAKQNDLLQALVLELKVRLNNNK